MDRQEALKVIEEFNSKGGSLFIDGGKFEDLTDNDIISLAQDCRKLMDAHERKEKMGDGNHKA